MKMMLNSSQVSHFTLAAYSDTGLFKHLIFLLILCLYVLIIVSNLLLIVVICMNRSLHEPTTALFPLLLIQVLTDVHTISTEFCFLQIYCIYTYATIEFFCLAVMSYDRYLAICCPLQYNVHMTSKKVALLIALTWLIPLITVVVIVMLTVTLPLCGNVIYKVYCGNWAIAKLACVNTRVNNIFGLLYMFVSVVLPLILILFTYMRILKICFSGCKQTRQKALSTCSPHLASLINFFFGCCFQIVQSRFDMSSVPNIVNILLSLYFLTCQPLFTPVLYGLKMSKIFTIYLNPKHSQNIRDIAHVKPAL
uniref:Olfactory receptor n=1 Tax=Cynoglossus semilaevis TaxID=244447 RepID=A0A3P8V4N6_CYNSE